MNGILKRCWPAACFLLNSQAMKYSTVLLLALFPAFASADALKISAQVLDRANDGSAIRGQYVYPSVELESGETANVHIGNDVRYPVWTQKVDLGDGVSKDEIVYEESPIGLELSIKYELDEGIITYCGKAQSTIAKGTVNGMTLSQSVDAIFYGQTELGAVVEAAYTGPDGSEETILLHFGPAEGE